MLEKPLKPNTPFISKNGDLSFSIIDFWQWNQSSLLDNTLRGTLAEFIVMKALNIESKTREEWAPYDLITKEGMRIEVKSAAYLQAWEQLKPSKISFGIAPAAPWDWAIDKRSTKIQRNSDVYIFCVFEEYDEEKANPLNMDQWTFYILTTKEINEKLGQQKTITLNSLLKLSPAKTDFQSLSKRLINYMDIVFK